MNQKRITRAQLYEAVWSAPLYKVAKTYNISPTRLAEICDTAEVPRPDPSYWPSLRLGFTMEKSPLPPTQPGSENIEIAPRRIKPPATPKELPSEASKPDAIEPEAAPPAAIPQKTGLELATDFRKAHPLVRAARELLEHGDKSDTGIQCADWSKPCLDVSVSRSQLRRALLIMDVILRELEKRGHSASLGNSRSDTQIHIDKETVRIALTEKSERHERKLTEEEKTKSYIYNRYTFHPTGKLSFQIHEYLPSGARKIWADGKHQRIEDFLSEIVDAILATGAALKQARLEQEEQSRRWAEEARIREEIRRRREEEITRQNALQKESVNWRDAEQVSEYIQVCRHRLAGQADVGPGSPARRWIEWALLQADRLDPLCNGWLDTAVAALPPDSMRVVDKDTTSHPPPPSPA